MAPETNSDLGADDRSYYDGAAGYDIESVRFFDIAHEGAHVRAIAQAAELLDGLRNTSPRSVVVLVTDAVSEAAAQCAVALLDFGRAPVMVTRFVPEFVGALDVVIVVGDAPDAENATRLISASAGRGAEVVLAGPASGPVVEDIPRGVICLPAPPTADGASPLRTIAAIAAVCATLTDTQALIDGPADAIDFELRQLSPERDVSVNAARQLREFVDGARILHTGYTPVGAAVAALVSALWSAHGLPSGFVGREDLARALEQTSAESAGNSSGATDDIFYDPLIDGPPAQVPVKTIVWAQRDAHLLGARAEYVEADGAAATGDEFSAALRLIVRGLAATAMQVE